MESMWKAGDEVTLACMTSSRPRDDIKVIAWDPKGKIVLFDKNSALSRELRPGCP